MIYGLFTPKLDLVQNPNQANLALRLWISLVASTLQGARCLAGRVHGRCRQKVKEGDPYTLGRELFSNKLLVNQYLDYIDDIVLI